MNQEQKTLLEGKGLELVLQRLCLELKENYGNFSDAVLIGLQPRGALLSANLHRRLEQMTGKSIQHGKLDITFFRVDCRRGDDIRRPNTTRIDFLTENKNVILIDDVLYTGRSVRAGFDALMAFGRPAKVELLTLIDRRYTRHIPIEANYCGKAVDTHAGQKVMLQWDSTQTNLEKVTLFTRDEV